MFIRSVRAIGIAAAVLLVAQAAAALSPDDKCEAAKNKEAGKYAFCRQKAEATAIKKGSAPDYSKCDAKFSDKWGKAETNGGGMCPTNGDLASMQARITTNADAIAACLNGTCPPSAGFPATGQTTSYGTGSDGDVQAGAARSFTDNGDGTITDNLTGLMWEKKSDDGSIHDKDDTYTWGLTSSPYTMNGTMVTTFLAALNGGGGFAGYTDWRIPNLFELESLVNAENVGPATYSAFNTSCTASCSVTTCSCTQSFLYWSSTTFQFNSAYAWRVAFGDGSADGSIKGNPLCVRAVRGGS